jgi:hypothetical protein
MNNTHEREKQKKTEELVNKEIYTNQTVVVDALLKHDFFTTDEMEGMVEKEQEIYEWWLVTERLANCLEEKGEIILFLDGLDRWWGRTMCGQSLYMDSVLQKIAEEIY